MLQLRRELWDPEPSAPTRSRAPPRGRPRSRTCLPSGSVSRTMSPSPLFQGKKEKSRHPPCLKETGVPPYGHLFRTPSQVSRGKNCLCSSSAPSTTPGQPPGGVQLGSGGWVGSGESEASYPPPLTSQSSVQLDPVPTHSLTAQSAFAAWKEKETRLAAYWPPLSPGEEDLSLVRSYLQGHCHATCPKCSGETEAS